MSLRGNTDLSFPRVLSFVLGTAATSPLINVPTGEKWELIEAIESHSTAGSDAGAVTLLVEKLTGTTAPGSGTAMTSTVSLKATANTPQSAALSTTKANLQVSGGDRVGVKVAGTTTALAGAVLTLFFKPIKR